MSIQVSIVKRLGAQPELLWLAAHFVERGQTVVNVKHGVLETLRHNRAGALLKFEDEMHMLFAPLCIQVLRKSKKQNVAEKIEGRFLHRRIAAFGRGDCALNYLSIFFAHRMAGGEISPINREAGDRLSHGAGERFKCKIAIPAIVSGKPVESFCDDAFRRTID